MLQQLRSRMGKFWCILAHNSPMWPVYGHYECRICGRRYPAFMEEASVNLGRRGVLKPAVPVILAWHSEGGK